MVNTPNVPIHRLKFSELKNKILHIGLYGLPGMGKTRFARLLAHYLIQCLRIWRVCVFVGNKDAAAEWECVVPPLQIFFIETQMHLLDNIYNHASEIVSEARKKFETEHPGEEFFIPTHLQHLIIFDDTGHFDEFLKNKMVKKIATQSRHAGINSFWNLQDINQLPPKAKKMHTHLALFHNTEHDHIERIYKSYSGKLMSKARFESYYTQVAFEKNRLLWINSSNDCATTVESRYRFFENKYANPTKRPYNPILENHSRRHYLSEERRAQVEKICHMVKDRQNEADSNDKTSLFNDEYEDDNDSGDDDYSGINLNKCNPKDIASIIGTRRHQKALTNTRNHVNVNFIE